VNVDFESSGVAETALVEKPVITFLILTVYLYETAFAATVVMLPEASYMSRVTSIPLFHTSE